MVCRGAEDPHRGRGGSRNRWQLPPWAAVSQPERHGCPRSARSAAGWSAGHTGHWPREGPFSGDDVHVGRVCWRQPHGGLVPLACLWRLVVCRSQRGRRGSLAALLAQSSLLIVAGGRLPCVRSRDTVRRRRHRRQHRVRLDILAGHAGLARRPRHGQLRNWDSKRCAPTPLASRAAWSFLSKRM